MGTAITQPRSPVASSGNVAEPAKDLVHGVWLAAIGLVAGVGQQTGRAIGALVKKGREVEPRIGETLKKTGGHVSDAANAVGTQLNSVGTRVKRSMTWSAAQPQPGLENKIREVLTTMDLPTREEIKSLLAKIDTLSAKLGQESHRPADSVSSIKLGPESRRLGRRQEES